MDALFRINYVARLGYLSYLFARKSGRQPEVRAEHQVVGRVLRAGKRLRAHVAFRGKRRDVDDLHARRGEDVVDAHLRLAGFERAGSNLPRRERGFGSQDALVRVAEVNDFDLVSGEDVFKIFQREREGVVLSLLRKTKGIAVVDARHKLGVLSRSIETHMAEGRDNTGAAAVRAARRALPTRAHCPSHPRHHAVARRPLIPLHGGMRLVKTPLGAL